MKETIYIIFFFSYHKLELKSSHTKIVMLWSHLYDLNVKDISIVAHL